MAVAYAGSDTLTRDPYTTLLDSTLCAIRDRHPSYGVLMTDYNNPYHSGYAPVPPTPPTGRSVLPIISLVVSILALAGVLVLAVLLGVSGALGAGGGDAPLTGQLSSSLAGALRGEVLAQDITEVISDDGGDVSDLRCPDTPSVHQGIATICHGTISGSAWAVAVFFEDSEGRFTALPM